MPASIARSSAVSPANPPPSPQGWPTRCLIPAAAQRGNVARLVLGSSAKIAAAGCALGILGSLAVSRLIGAFLFGVSATNPIVYAASICLMLALALLALTLPALRAAAADPARVLRSE